MDGCTNYNFIERVSIINFTQSKTLIKWTRNLWLKISIMNSYLADVKYEMQSTVEFLIILLK